MLSAFRTICLFLPVVSSFRAPENVARNVKLPSIDIRPDVEVRSELVTTKDSINLSMPHRVTANKWGIDKSYDSEYWYNPTIHTLGNVGFFGAIHAALAPLSTKLIDVIAYEGVDVRQKVAHELSDRVKSSKARVIDLCCGVGISTRALQNAFPEAETVIGVDTSSEMISMATFLSKHLSLVKPLFLRLTNQARDMALVVSTTFSNANAERTQFPSRSFDLVTVMYAFHEAPEQGRENILREAHRLLQPGGIFAVVDICSEYKPSKSMLAGEPYVLEYQQNIHSQLRAFRGFAKVTYKTIVPNHVGMWVMKRATM